MRMRQRRFAFLERSIRRERGFRWAILAATLAAVVVVLGIFPWEFLVSRALDAWAGQSYRDSLHTFRTRDEIDASWREFRRAGIERTQGQVARYSAENNEAFRALLRYAAMDPDHALFGWGNFDWTLLLSSKVFEPDEKLSYRLRPGVRSVWLHGKDGKSEGNAFFLIPDGPELAELVRPTRMRIVEGSRQLTNSWGLRGPEPDPGAKLRVLILGDSIMQGMFIGQDETPPECLRRHLERAIGGPVSVLNTGLMGYSPEQYYYSMERYADRFRPDAVVVSVFANDCGSIAKAVDRGEGDWKEGRYWLGRIVERCEARGWPYLIVPAPYELDLVRRRHPGNYPGALANVLAPEGASYFDPSEDFLNAHLKARMESRRAGKTPEGCVLFNDALMDAHFSAAGAEVWAESVGRRLLLRIEDFRASMPAKGPAVSPDRGGNRS